MDTHSSDFFALMSPSRFWTVLRYSRQIGFRFVFIEQHRARVLGVAERDAVSWHVRHQNRLDDVVGAPLFLADGISVRYGSRPVD